MKLLNSGNYKTKKGEARGYITYGLHLAPSDLSGFNVCPFASKGCRASCLNTAGRGIMANVQKARIAKTRFLKEDRTGFLAQLHKEIESSSKSAARKNMTPCFRLNLTSDVDWLDVIDKHRDLRFYDYTKDYRRALDFANKCLPANYHITFSRSETHASHLQCREFLDMGGNVAAVFSGTQLPDNYHGGYAVVDGDVDDLRFLDPSPCIVGLLAKGKAKQDKTGFVINA